MSNNQLTDLLAWAWVTDMRSSHHHQMSECRVVSDNVYKSPLTCWPAYKQPARARGGGDTAYTSHSSQRQVFKHQLKANGLTNVEISPDVTC